MCLFCKGEIKNRFCCGNFNPKDSYALEPKGYSERILESGFCPQCGTFVVEVCKRNLSGEWTFECAKRKKALKLWNCYKSDIIGNLVKSIRYGNHSKMGYRYGENVEVRTKKNEYRVQQYAIDFNGTKELIKTI